MRGDNRGSNFARTLFQTLHFSSSYFCRESQPRQTLVAEIIWLGWSINVRRRSIRENILKLFSTFLSHPVIYFHFNKYWPSLKSEAERWEWLKENAPRRIKRIEWWSVNYLSVCLLNSSHFITFHWLLGAAIIIRRLATRFSPSEDHRFDKASYLSFYFKSC